MSLGKKLLAGFTAMLGLVLVFSIAGWMVVEGLTADVDRVANRTARQQYLAGAINASASELASMLRGRVLGAVIGDSAGYADYEKGYTGEEGKLEQNLSQI